jgi:hypothetical protein
MWGIRWGIVQRMMADAPKYNYDSNNGASKSKSVTALTNENAAEMMEHFNRLNDL